MMHEYNYGGAQFPYKRHGHSGLDRLENKSALSNPYNYSKNSSKISKFDRLNSSHTVTSGDEKGITPLRSESIKTELHREAILEGARRSGRLRTDESDKLKRMDISFDSVYLEKQKVLQEQKRKIVPAVQHARALSNSRGGRNILAKDYLNLSKGSVEESVIEPLRKKIYPRLQNKRTSAQVEKSFTNNFMDTTLPTILINGVERIHKEKSTNARATATSEFQALDSPSTRPKNRKKESIVNKLLQPTGPRPENSNGMRKKIKQGTELSPNHENLQEGYSFTQHLRSTSSLAGHNEKEQNAMNRSLLDGVSSSINAKGQLNTTVSIDYAFERVTELTNKNNLARYDLLKIQESALELKMRLNARRTQLGRPMKDMNRTNQTVIEELNSYNSLFAMDSEL